VSTRRSGAPVRSAAWAAVRATSAGVSPHASTTCARASHRSATSMPRRSTGSSVSRSPAVSISRSGHGARSTVASSASRVVPGTSVTRARASPASALNSDDLPAFGGPAMTHTAPSRAIAPAGAVASSPSTPARTSAAARAIRPRDTGPSSSSGKSMS
jgi:hypothetical protein